MKARAGWLVIGGLGYALAVVVVVQIALGSGFLAGLGLPAATWRTGGYDSKLPEVAAVDPERMAKAVAEASGGPPTIASPPPIAEASTDRPATAPDRSAPAKSAPASSKATQAMPPTIASLIASLPPSLQPSIRSALQKPRPHDG